MSIAESIARIEEETTLRLVRDLLKKGRDPYSIIEELRKGVEEVGKQFSCSNLFLTDLIMAGEIFKQAIEIVKPRITGDSTTKSLGTVVIGTVKGDVHDIGKNIVVMSLETAGFDVLDLGVDIPAERFLDGIISKEAKVVGMSVLMTTSFDPMKNTIELIRRSKVAQVKVMVGGGPTNETVARSVGADAYGSTAIDAVRMAKEWLS